MTIRDRLGDITHEQLKEKKAVWHVSCYSVLTLSTDINRAKLRYNKALSSHRSSPLKRKRGRPSAKKNINITPYCTDTRCTRSQIPDFEKKKCFFCQEKQCTPLIKVTSSKVGAKMASIIQMCDNNQWKVNYSELINSTDALSRDIMYHHSCMTTQWKKYCVSKRERKEVNIDSQQQKDSVSYIVAEIQFYSQLQEAINAGDFIPITDVENDYQNIMKEHQQMNVAITRASLKEKIKQNIDNVEFTRSPDRRKPSFVHTSAMREAAVSNAATESKINDLKTILTSAKAIRKVMEKNDAWRFNGALNEDCGVPIELTVLLKWIIQGHHTAKSEARSEHIERLCKNLAQQIMLGYKSKTQVLLTPKSESANFRNRTNIETPLTLGLSLTCYHATRCKHLIDLLSHAGVSVPYKHTLKRVTNIACAVKRNIDEHQGVYLPPGILYDKLFRASIDNIDAKVDTPDGKQSFHALAATVFQENSEVEYNVTEKLNLDDKYESKLKNVPNTVTLLKPCTISGSPKPQTSPYYPSFKPLSHQAELQGGTETDQAPHENTITSV